MSLILVGPCKHDHEQGVSIVTVIVYCGNNHLGRTTVIGLPKSYGTYFSNLPIGGQMDWAYSGCLFGGHRSALYIGYTTTYLVVPTIQEPMKKIGIY